MILPYQKRDPCGSARRLRGPAGEQLASTTEHTRLDRFDEHCEASDIGEERGDIAARPVKIGGTTSTA
jgi:hypothetical protein